MDVASFMLDTLLEHPTKKASIPNMLKLLKINQNKNPKLSTYISESGHNTKQSIPE